MPGGELAVQCAIAAPRPALAAHLQGWGPEYCAAAHTTKAASRATRRPIFRPQRLRAGPLAVT